MTRLCHWYFRNYVWLLAVLFVFTFCLPLLVGALVAPAGIFGWLAIHLALFFFTQKQHLADKRMTTELLLYFHWQHALLQPQLRAVLEAEDVPSAEQNDTLDAYFALCAEQYCHFQRGLIPPGVWESWRNRMRIYYYNALVRKRWDQAFSRQTALYGFDKQLLK
ncbi:MAG: hypothetical protein HKP58_12655 [Desulfatitalea sp.]|nr:hypothetical protein [Desulfatitalea sp.]NNK01250.1 hypothetical protein [Desulfatitalea sp.]